MSTIEAYSRAYNQRIAARQSPAYLQAGPRGQRRMEQAMDMGMGMMDDPSSYRRTGRVDPMTGRPIYGASRWEGGGWGSVGMDRKRKGSTGKLTSGPALGSAGSSGYALAEKIRSEKNEKTRPTSVAAQSRAGYDERLARDVSPVSSQLGFGGTSALPFTGFGGMVREDMTGGASPYSSYWNQTLAPRFPFSNY
jgi:hypothetical protein